MTGTRLSWANYPVEPQTLHPVHWQSSVRRTLDSISTDSGSTLAFGNGRSYGDVCYAASGRVIHTRTLDRVLQFDRDTGRIQAEAGITLGEILQIIVPAGWFLPVTPGTKFVTLGGAIANDVHGKNHHTRGTFGRFIQRLGLLRSDRDPIICSPTQEPELFAATIAGLGLTGIIAWAELQLVPVKSAQMTTIAERFDHVSEFFDMSARYDATNEYGVAWIDCTSPQTKLGRGVYIAASHAQEGNLNSQRSAAFNIPWTPPVSAVNSATTRVFNWANWHRQPATPVRATQHFDPYFYPLDQILHWNRLYGRKGFQQFQCVLPESVAEHAVAELLREISREGNASFLTVLKRCGGLASPGLLSFPLPGATLAVDFPDSVRLRNRLLPALDKIVSNAGGRLYPAKDAHMTGEDFRKAYPNWQHVERHRDPRIMSRFWQRVTS